ncbi:hypothetical protein ACJ73_04570 [Blastomyces percursus]|uniref:Alpha/beta hydrolase fold-3 domain-containing protein n=1 Tax=Blastomyces percursus TaxID=1658174 RepID=A0A1J9Q6A6_9EURO|nr:hypothetical protein ACJ73_04570 [Blastomyces percursus]
MTIHTSLVVDSAKFRPDAVPEVTIASNKFLSDLMKAQPNWWDVGVVKYREMMLKGETGIPAPVLLPEAKAFSIPSREAGRSIPCRVMRPAANTPPTGIFMHMHYGGWTLGSEEQSDPRLKKYVDATNLMAISIGYRLAPENPYPAAPHDCFDAAEWLVQNGEAEFGAPLKFLGGESAGGHLAMVTVQHLLSHKDPKFSQFKPKGLVLHFGVFDVSWTPSMFNFKQDPPLLIGLEFMNKCRKATFPDRATNFKDPSISPLYFNFFDLPAETKLPPAFFTCGTEDILLDDTIFMSAKWQMAGGEAIVKIVPGAPHGYFDMPEGMYPGTDEVRKDMYQFMMEKM